MPGRRLAARRCRWRYEPGDDGILDETSILNFRHLLERHGLTQALFAEVKGHLADKGITLRFGTLVEVSWRTPYVRGSPRKINDAPSSTKNTAGRVIPKCHPRRRTMTSISE